MNLKKLSIIILLIAVVSLLSIAPVNAVVKNAAFDSDYYADHYADLKEAFGNDADALYNHFITAGIAEGRVASPVFDVTYYLSTQSDLKAAGMSNIDAYNHFINYGMNEARSASASFNPAAYKQAYGDLAGLSGADLYAHYLNYGVNEGRSGVGTGATVPEDHVHEFELTKVLIAPTCKTDGEGVYTCACGNVPEEVRTIPASAEYHDYVYNRTEGLFKIYVCSVCNDTKVEKIEGEAHVHNYVETFREEATCTKAGKIIKTCNVEGCPADEKVVTETIPMIDHVSDTATGKGYIITPATKCSADGEERVTCKVCGQEFIRPISAHNYDNGVVAVAAKCTETGTMKYTCKDCGATKTEDIEALGHNLGTTIELVAPTCEKTGISEKVCSRCGYEEKTITKATGHSFEGTEAEKTIVWLDEDGKEVESVPAAKQHTCYYTKAEKYTCTNANCDSELAVPQQEGQHYVYKIVKKATGHIINTTKPVKEGYATLKLKKVDGEDNVYTYDEGNMYVTDEKGIVLTTTGTVDCSHEKIKVFTCSECNASQIVVLQGRTAHTGSVVTVPTTCTEKGYTLTSCTKCNKVIKEVNEKAKLLDHEYSFVPATCTEAAYIKCDIGGEKYTGYVGKVESDEVVKALKLNDAQKAELTNNTPLGHKIVANSDDNTKGYCANEDKWIEGAAIAVDEKESAPANTNQFTSHGGTVDSGLTDRMSKVNIVIKDNVVTITQKENQKFTNDGDDHSKNAIGIMLDVGIKAKNLAVKSSKGNYTFDACDTDLEQMKKWNPNATENSFMIWLLPSEIGEDGISMTFSDKTGYTDLTVTVKFVFDANGNTNV